MRDRIGKFDIIRLIGQGAMGEVYLGRDPKLGREVAVKTILPSTAFGEEATARFEREARAAGSMNHPNVAMVYEFGVDEGLHYMAMEFIEGEDLDGLIRQGRTSLPVLLELLAQACDGLAYAHERAVVHRDIKPANILVSRTGKRPVAKVVDFGVALMGQSDLTQKGDWMGTVNYMAPEYLDSGKATPACDIFALGVILYEIIAGGRRPFTGETPTTVLTAILRQNPSPFTPEEVQAVNPLLLEVVNKALAKAPQDRYATADLMAAAIRAAVAGPGTTQARTVQLKGLTLPPAAPGTLVVGKGGKGQCMSLRVALRQARAGTTILVMPGVYRESLVVDKDVTLTGEGAPGEVIIESLKGPCLTLTTPQASLSNLMLVAQGTGPALVLSAGRPQVEGCLIEVAGGPAVAMTGAGADPVFRDCTLRGSGPLGVLAGALSGATFQDCLLEGSFLTGFLVEAGARPTLQRCRILNTRGVGLRLLPGAHATLDRCNFAGQAGGAVEVEAEGRLELNHCRITDSGSVGVLALARSNLALEDCDLTGHAVAALHAVEGAVVQLRACRVRANGGLGVSVLGAGLLTMELCDLSENGEPAVLVHRGATVQMKTCKVFDGQSFGLVCAGGGKGVLDGCEIYGNAKTGAKVEPGGSLLLVRCDLRDGRDTGILLFEDAEVTLEECVVHRNARGGILLAKDASDPILRGGNRIQDDLLRTGEQGGVVKVVPVKRR
jgi:hypothetical protein